MFFRILWHKTAGALWKRGYSKYSESTSLIANINEHVHKDFPHAIITVLHAP